MDKKIILVLKHEGDTILLSKERVEEMLKNVMRLDCAFKLVSVDTITFEDSYFP